jgi:hypothetical protein
LVNFDIAVSSPSASIRISPNSPLVKMSSIMMS